MTLGRREKVLLGLLSLVAVVFLFTRAGTWLDALHGGDDFQTRADRGGASVALDSDVVQLAQLEPEIYDHEVERDPFRFGQPPPPPPQPPRPQPQQPVERKPPPPPPPVDNTPQPPALDFAFLGSFGPEDRRIAVLTDGETLYNVRLGDEVEGVVRVRDVGYETIELEYIDFPEAPTVRLEVGS